MVVTKRVQIEFASPQIRAIDEIQDLRRAVKSASPNLNLRYGVILEWPMPYGDRVILDMRVPVGKAENFRVGKHLRGLSTFLLDKYKDKYEPYRVGKRLLNYIEISQDPPPSPEVQLIGRMEAIVDFAKLLERTDEQAEDAIDRILEILMEVKE